MADWDVVGTAPAQVQNPWAVKSNAPAPSEHGIAAPGTPLAHAGAVGETALSAITGGLGSLIDALTMSPPGTHNFTYQPRTAEGKALGKVLSSAGQAATGVASSGIGSVVGALGGDPEAAAQTAQERIPEALGAVGTVAPLAAGVGRIGGALSDAAAASAAEAATPAAQLGLRTAANAPIARTVAGKSGQEALNLQNIQAGNTIAGAQAGVPHGVPVNPTSLSAARAAPGEVLDRAAADLPTGPLSPAAAEMVQNADTNAGRITKGTPNAVAQIQDIKDRLLDPEAQFTGAQIRAEANGLRADSNMQSADPDVRQVSQFRRKAADALDQHVEDMLPPDSTTSLAQIKLARQTLAKNYTVQDLLGPGGDVDLQKLAQLHRDSPNLLTGDLRTLGQFANDHPEVSTPISNATRYAPPGLGKDIGQVNIINPRSWVQPLGGFAARRSLAGTPGASLEAAQQAPVAGLANEFAPRGGPPAPPTGGLANDLAPPSGSPGPPTGPAGQRGSMSFQPLANNASGESAASQEAINRGTSPLVEVDPDGNERPILRDVTQADINPAPHHIIVDKSTGQIVKSGNMAPALARGLLNRWKSMQLGNAF